MPDPNAFVAMTHPDVHTTDSDLEPASATRAAFEQVWEPKGWELVGDDAAAPIAAPATPRPPFTPPASAATTKES